MSHVWQYLIELDFKISHKCCDVLKKNPFKQFEKETNLHSIVGTMAGDSHLRYQMYARSGCNSFAGKIESKPLSFWYGEDIWEYMNEHHIGYSQIYDMGERTTGCMFCMFGAHREKGENRFQRMQKTHPKQYKYCMENLGMKDVLDAIGVETEEKQIEMFK